MLSSGKILMSLTLRENTVKKAATDKPAGTQSRINRVTDDFGWYYSSIGFDSAEAEAVKLMLYSTNSCRT